MLDAVPGEPDSVSLAYEGRELVGLRPMVKKGQEQCKGEASPFRTFCLQNNKNQKIKLSLFPNRLVSLTRNLIRFMIQASLPLFPPGWCLSSGGLRSHSELLGSGLEHIFLFRGRRHNSIYNKI